MSAARDASEFSGRFKGFVEKYSEDVELLAIYEDFQAAKGGKDLEKARAAVAELSKVRKLGESGGGTYLPYKDRRHLDG